MSGSGSGTPDATSFWEALLVIAAVSARCDRLWTEDLADGQTLLGVRIENPLKDGCVQTP